MIRRSSLSLAVLLPVALGAASPADEPGSRAVHPVEIEIREEGIPGDRTWPEAVPEGQERYQAPAFAVFRLPHRYVDTGVRGDRSNPLLLRATAEVTFPPGSHRILLRGRGASRLSIDEDLILSTPFPPPITDGHSPIPDDFLELGPDFRFAPPGNREAWTTFKSAGGSHRVVLETIVGGLRGDNPLRLEPGETVVAWSREGSESFQLLTPEPDPAIPYTDPGWSAFATEEERRLARIEADRRAQAFLPHAAEWAERRAFASDWLSRNPGPAPPEGDPTANPIDRFLAEARASARDEGPRSGAVDYPIEIGSILEARCFSCHQGSSVKGWLRLDTDDGVRSGGDSGAQAIVPGDSEGSELVYRIATDDEFDRMPPTGPPLTEEEIDLIRLWIEEGAPRASRSSPRPVAPVAEDLEFLRRVSLDSVGVIPTEEEISRFLDDPEDSRRTRAIDRLLDDPRWADHRVSYWQDVLAENPNILNPTLNNTGPFRWWIHEALLDNRPVDLVVTELIRMRGSPRDGGPAGFGMASQNDVPMAEKAVIIGSAFLGMNMACARCHDAPAHETSQEQLFGLAAMLAEGPITVPKTSSVPRDAFHDLGRPPLIEVTLEPGSVVSPAWTFPGLIATETPPDWLPFDASPRDRLAALITSPANERFAEVIVNRVWARLMGRGLVEPVDDWEKGERTHPELLTFLARDFVRGGHDLKHLNRLIFNSLAYQRASDPDLTEPDPSFSVRNRRRLSAEQVVDSLFLAVGKPLKTEEINLDVDGGRPVQSSISLGLPTRAWQFASTSNERDRPSLTLPRVQAVVDVLQAFGWRATRPNPLTSRDDSPNVLQPAILANGPAGTWLTRLSDDHGITALALEDHSVEMLVDRLFLRIFTRSPRADERDAFVSYLTPGFDDRILDPSAVAPTPTARTRPRYVSWSNHLTEEADVIQRQRELEARLGDPPSDRLDEDWRVRLEDVLWSLINAPEFLFMP